MKRHLVLTIVMMLSLVTAAQDVMLRMISQTPVPGAEEARSLLFDEQGLMWIGTDQGIRAYDGYRFKTYRSDAYTPGILHNNYVICMTADQQDGLWIGTRDGLVRYDRRRGTFKTYHLQGEQARTINALFTASDGKVWAGTNSGMAHYEPEKDDFVSISMTAGVRSFVQDEKGNLYIGTWEAGLYRFDAKSGRLVEYPRMDARNTAQSLLMDSKGRLWIGTWEHGIIRLDHPENEADPGIHQVNEGRKDFRTFHHLIEDSVSHAIWGCCIEGLTHVDIDDMTKVGNHPDLSFCYDMKTDGHGNLWVLTRNDGIIHLSTKPSPFTFSHLDPTGQVLPVNRIQTVFTTDGDHFWLGLQPYGLALYDRQQKQVKYNNQIPGFETMTGITGIHVQTISDMMQRQEDELWMASTQGILILKKGQPARRLPRNGVPFINDGNVNTFHSLQDGTVLVGLNGGIGLAFSENEGQLLKMTEQNHDFSNCNVHSIVEDHLHRIWVATEESGIIRIDGNMRQPESLKYHQYISNNGNYPIDEATDCYEDAEHRLWAISNSGGLFLYNTEKDSFEPINHRIHLRAISVYAIEGDSKGRLWLSTDKGLVRIKVDDKGEVTSAYYGIEDGIDDIRFSSNGFFRYGKQLYFGSASGFFSFDPCTANNWQQKTPLSLVVTELFIDDQPYSWINTTERSQYSENQPIFTDELTIPASVKKFSVEFSLLTFHNPQQSLYAYQLEGYDHDWHFTDAENRMATYQNLPPGNYELHLRATDSYGHQTELPYTISIQVLPPWYKTWWAYLVYLLLLAAIVYGISRWYTNRVNRQARLQQRVSELLHYREMMIMKQFEGARKAIEAEEQQHNSPDEIFIQKAIDCVKLHLDDADYDRERFASDMCVSSSTLYNKLRALTGQNVTAFVNSIRLKEACRILRQRPDIKMSELSMAVGFNTPKYFAKLFKKEFGVLPSEFIEEGNL